MGLTRQGRIPGLWVLAILALLTVGAYFVGYSVANPYSFTGEVPPDQETYPPVITIASPRNNTAYNTSRVPLTFNVTAPQSKTASSSTVHRVTYEADWQNEAIDLLQSSQEQPSFNLQLSNIPEGQHSITIKADGNGIYMNEEELSYKTFFISSTATISFTIDCTAPTVSVLPPENVSSTSPIPLNVTVNEAYSKIAYSLNGQQNVTVGGNLTIPHLPAGQYNVTFYVWDIAGNIGTSETANFTVAEIPQTTGPPGGSLLLPVAAILSTVVIIGIVLLFRRRIAHQGSIKA
jgi:hypothetical protein